MDCRLDRAGRAARVDTTFPPHPRPPAAFPAPRTPILSMTSAGGTVPTTNPSVVTVGTFDGVHAGHRALVERARALARALHPAARTAALVFDPNPIEVLRPAKAPPRLTTFDQKRSFLLAAGADEV